MLLFNPLLARIVGTIASYLINAKVSVFVCTGFYSSTQFIALKFVNGISGILKGVHSVVSKQVDFYK